jgi:phage shock protein PspC (stress-responsive transcriptional regulator)
MLYKVNKVLAEKRGKFYKFIKEFPMRYDREYSSIKSVRQTLCKDMKNKKLTGVCAGVAKHYDLPRLAVRIGAVAALIMLPVATGVAYVVASILLPNSKYY